MSPVAEVCRDILLVKIVRCLTVEEVISASVSLFPYPFFSLTRGNGVGIKIQAVLTPMLAFLASSEYLAKKSYTCSPGGQTICINPSATSNMSISGSKLSLRNLNAAVSVSCSIAYNTTISSSFPRFTNAGSRLIADFLCLRYGQERKQQLGIWAPNNRLCLFQGRNRDCKCSGYLVLSELMQIMLQISRELN